MSIFCARAIFTRRRLLVAKALEPSLAGSDHERGFALLLVLWTMSLLALLATQVTAAGRTELRLSSALTAQAHLQSAADAAIYETIWHLMDGPESWQPDMGAAHLAEHGIDVDVTIVDDRGKLDLNAASGDLAAAFFAVLGANRDTAQTLAARLTEWRTGQLPQDDAGRTMRLTPPPVPSPWGPPGRDLQRLDELRLIPGMTDPFYRAMLPHLVLHLDQGPLYRVADAVVRAAMDTDQRERQVSQAPPDPRIGYVVHLRARAVLAGAAVSREAEIRISGTIGHDMARYRVLSWD